MICVYWWRTRRAREWLDSEDNLTPNRGSLPSEFREMLFIKFKCHGIGINVFYLRVIFIYLMRKELSCNYIVASVNYNTGSLGPSSRDTRGRVSPLGQPHLPVRQMNGA